MPAQPHAGIIIPSWPKPLPRPGPANARQHASARTILVIATSGKAPGGAGLLRATGSVLVSHYRFVAERCQTGRIGVRPSTPEATRRDRPPRATTSGLQVICQKADKISARTIRLLLSRRAMTGCHDDITRDADDVRMPGSSVLVDAHPRLRRAHTMHNKKNLPLRGGVLREETP